MLGSPADIERRQRIGSAVHQVTAILDCNGILFKDAKPEWLEPYLSISPEVEGFIKAWEKFKRDMDFKPVLVEHTITPKDWHYPEMVFAKFATTLDRAGMLRGCPALVELKTPKIAEPWWGVQLAGQELALLCSNGSPVVRPYKYCRFVAQLFSSGKYKPIMYEDSSDRDVFLWSLGLTTWNRRAYRNGK